MSYRTRIKYTAAQKAEMWDRWQRGESLNAIGRLFDRPSSSIFGQLAPTGGIRPAPRRRSRRARILVAEDGCSPPTISRFRYRSTGFMPRPGTCNMLPQTNR